MMLSISRIRANAKAAAQYYLTEEAALKLQAVELKLNDPNVQNNATLAGTLPTSESASPVHYYLAEQDSTTQSTTWSGKLAATMGWAGQAVDAATLEQVLAGQLGDRTVWGKREHHRPGFDLTFSAPKSVSILALEFGDQRLLQAHDAAVIFATQHIEKNAAQAKHTDPENGQPTFENTGQLLFAHIRHQTSREHEPQLHTHVLMPNMTLDKHGVLRALASCRKQDGREVHGTAERIYTHQKYFGMLYHSHLAEQVEKMGYTLRAVGHGQFEIDGVPQALIDAKSTRRQQVKEHAENLGFTSRAGYDVAAKATRAAKAHTPTATLQQQWHAVSQSHDFDGAAFVAQSYTRTLHTEPSSRMPSDDKPTIDVNAQTALDRSLRHHSQFSSTLSYEKLITSAVQDFATGETVSALAVKHALDAAIQQRILIPLDNQSSRLTTQALLDAEKALLRYTDATVKPHRCPSATMTTLGLNASQQATVQSLLASPSMVNIIECRGESAPLAQALRQAGIATNYRVQFVTPNKLQQTALKQQQASAPPSSITQWLRQKWHGESVHTIGQWLNQDKLPPANTLLVVTEAQRLGLDETRQLLAQADTAQHKVVLLQSRDKPRGYRAGNPIATLQQGGATTLHWQHQHTHTATVQWQAYRDDQRHSAVVNAYISLPDHQRPTAQVLTTSQQAVATLNALIREQRQIKGQIGQGSRTLTLDTLNPVYLSDAQRESAASYRQGWVITEWQDQRKYQYTIQAVSRRHNTLTLRDEHQRSRRVSLDTLTATQQSWQLSEPGQLTLAPGDAIRVNADHYPSRLQAHQRLHIAKIGRLLIKATDNHGKTYRFTHGELQQAPLSYDYAATIAQANPQATRLLVDSKAYAVSKNTLHELLKPHTQHITFFTDNSVKLAARLKQSTVQPSVMQHVLQAAGQTYRDTLINPQTTDVLMRDVQAALNTLGTQHKQTANADIVTRAVQHALAKISERQAGFQHQTLVIEAIHYALTEQGRALTQPAIEAKLNTLAEEGKLLSQAYSDGIRWTTQAALATEQRILHRLEQGKNTVTALASKKHVDHYLQPHDHLTQGQRQAITLIATTTDQHIAIQGLAGTGKSTMLATAIALVKAVESNTNAPATTRFVVLAPTHAAVQTLQQKGIEAHTLQSVLAQPSSDTTTHNQHRRTVFLIDEASMTSNKQWDRLTQWINQQSNARAVYLGDIKQLTAIEAGQPFALAMHKKAIHSVNMTDIVRQKEGSLKKAVHAVIDKAPESAIDHLQRQPQHPIYAHGQTSKNHVVSTYRRITGDRKHDRELADQALNAAAANDYLARTPDARKNTLIIAYTHKERDDIAQRIREGLQQEGRLDTQEKPIPRLRSLGLERAAMATMAPYQPGLVITVSPNDYYHIADVNKLNGFVTLQHIATGQKRYFFPSKHDHRFTQLWSLTTPKLAKGDAVMLKHTDRQHSEPTHTTYTVKAIGKDTVTLRDSHTQQPRILATNNLKDAHWDYAYTRTADLAQGTTVNNVITVIRSSAQLTNIRRAYIDITRAAEHVKVFTDSADKTVLAWYNHPSDKASAITTIDKAPLSSTLSKDNHHHVTTMTGSISHSIDGKHTQTTHGNLDKSVTRQPVSTPERHWEKGDREIG